MPSSSLSRRLASTAIHQESSDSFVLLPLDIVKQSLNDHPLIVNMQIQGCEVFRALIDLHNYITALRTGGTQFVSHDIDSCKDCKARLFVDETRGCEVCERCGLIQNENINLIPEFISAPEMLPSCRGIPGVSSKVSKCILSQQSVSKREDLDHWNRFVNISEDDISYAQINLNGWQMIHTQHSFKAKVAAVLLYKFFSTRVPDESHLRNCIRKKQTLPIININPRSDLQGKFECATCGVKCFDYKSSVWHCRFGTKKKRKR